MFDCCILTRVERDHIENKYFTQASSEFTRQYHYLYIKEL